MCRGEQWMHQWGRMSLFKSWEWEEGRRKPKITLLVIKKQNMPIKEVMESMILH